MKVGIWLDHRNAILAFLENGDLRVERVDSAVEPRVRLAGGSSGGRNPHGPQDTVSETRRDRRVQGEQHRYYQDLITHVRGAGLVYIIGPGEAKHEFLTELDAARIPDLVTELETTDKLTEAQVLAKVREHFGIQPPRQLPRS